MKRYIIHTAWGASFGATHSKPLPEFVQEIKQNGYLCVPFCYVSFSAVIGIEDLELAEALKEAGEQESWQ